MNCSTRTGAHEVMDHGATKIGGPTERRGNVHLLRAPLTDADSRKTRARKGNNTVIFEHEEHQHRLTIDSMSTLNGSHSRQSRPFTSASLRKDSLDHETSPTSVKDVSDTCCDENLLVLLKELNATDEIINLEGYESSDDASNIDIHEKVQRKHSWCEMIQESDWERLHTSLMNCKHHHAVVSADMVMHADSNTTVLHLAASNAPTAVMLLLLDVVATCSSTNPMNDITQGASTKNYLLCGDDDGNTPLHLACANLEHTTATQSGGNDTIDFSVIKNLLFHCPETLILENNNGDTALHLILASQAFRQRNGTKPSKDAVSVAVEAISAIVGMAENLAFHRNLSGLTPLHVAIANHCPKNVLLKLLSMAPEAATVVDNDGMTSLHYVAAFGVESWTFVQQLITIHPWLINQLTVNGDTPLHLLIANTSIAFYPGMSQDLAKAFTYHNSRHTMKLVTALLGLDNDKDSIPLLIQNVHGDTPLHFCTKMNTPARITQALMESSHASNAAVITAGIDMTPLRIAMSTLFQVGDHLDAVGLRNAICNIVACAIPESCAIVDSHGLTPLMHAVQSKKWSTILVKILLQADKESTKQASPDGLLPLHFACKNKKIKLATLRGMFDKWLSTRDVLLMFLFLAYNFYVVLIIIDLIKANPSGLKALCTEKNTPLHFAAMQGEESIMHLLITKHPKAVQQRNANGDWPIDLAINNGVSSDVLNVFDLLHDTSKKIKK
jgi:ankyrin repeat protein